MVVLLLGHASGSKSFNPTSLSLNETGFLTIAYFAIFFGD